MEKPQSSFQQGSVVARSFPPWLVDSCLLAVSSHGGQRAPVSRPLFIRVPVLSDQGCNRMTSFNLYFLLQDSVSNTCACGLMLQHTNFGRIQFNPQQEHFPMLMWALSTVPFNLMGQFFPSFRVVSSHLKTDQNSNEDSLQPLEASLRASLCFPILSVVNSSSLLLPTLLLDSLNSLEFSLEYSSLHHS